MPQMEDVIVARSHPVRSMAEADIDDASAKGA
jgi:hypothetical protein